MPQFDIITLGTQLTWVGISSIFLYQYCLKIVLPFYSSLKKIRKKKLQNNINEKLNFSDLNSNFLNSKNLTNKNTNKLFA